MMVRGMTVAMVLLLAMAGCGETEAEPENGEENSETVDNAEGEDNGGEEVGLPRVCEGDCREEALTVSYGGETDEIERAVYGLSSPGRTESREWELYIEALDGGFEGCPRQDSPSPRWTLIVAGLPAALEERGYEIGAGAVSMTFLDFDGKFLGGEPFVRATGGMLMPVAANVDVAVSVAGEEDEDGVAAFEVEAQFDEGGEVRGRLVATHCVSLDNVE